MFEIPAGGRRYCALELLVKQKRIARVAPVPCVVREDGIAEEDSLAENIQRAPLHPLDQFRAFLALREKGQSDEEIAAVSSSWSISSAPRFVTADYDAIVIPGGHGPVEDLYKDADMGRILVEADRAGQIIAPVCHGQAALLATRSESSD